MRKKKTIRNSNNDRQLTTHVSKIIVKLKFHFQKGKMDELTRENAKILQKIVEARQINVKGRQHLVNSIRKDEDRSRGVRDAMHREALRRQSEIAMSN